MSAYDSDIAPVAALLADRTRAAMLTAMLGGLPLAAGELAKVAGVTAQTASAHLARLLDGGLVTVIKQGRHRYYELKSADVAQVIEALSQISPPIEPRSLRQSRAADALRQARTCYDHLAGRAGVELFAGLCDNRLLEPESCDLTAEGEERLSRLGLEMAGLRGARRRFTGRCLDWTERRPHLSGALGAAITTRLIELSWLERGRVPRALIVTAEGGRGLRETFGCVLDEPVVQPT
ncbi:ArsR/SmtB family transcription factor [Actinomadura sp. HBU206391]|uniref:ArsR/SmtB family transcription factor n=1 Tax=Actinomadura sp. HBU206391 TaxID=2731692 RepID=UPI0016505515|nr:winged helix-turn-helix domain-containing protein [Actinomadura sp. HBU206391]MBC6462790.1 winged helix-turn-helix transcriptional regulator [Actinomadura sp. HBU206391]